MFTVKTSKAFNVSNLMIDGGSNAMVTQGDVNGDAFNIEAKSSAFTGVTLQNLNATGDGGAIYLKEGTMTLKDTRITGSAANNGGAVYVCSGATLSLEDTTAGNAITGNTAVTGGAGLYLEEGSAPKLAGKLQFGENTVVMEDYGDKENGGESAYTDNKVRQDIFIQGYTGAHEGEARMAESVVVTGSLSKPEGSGDGWIWVWAETPADESADNHIEENHYEMLKQFARFTSKLINEDTLHAFRNAQDDDVTGCGGDYLTGQEGEVAWCIYWTGGFDFAFLKIKGDGDPLNGAKFTLYTAVKDGDRLVPAKKGSKDVPIDASDELDESKWNAVKGEATATSKPIDSVTVKAYNEGGKPQDRAICGEGLVEFDKIPPGNYFMVETAAPDTWEPLYDVYRVYMDGSGWISISGVEKDADGRMVWPAATDPSKPADAPVATFIKGGDDKYVRAESVPEGADTVSVFNIMNVSTLERKVILRKVEKDTFASLKDVKFEILRADGSLVSGTDIDGHTVTSFTSGASGVYFIGKLPYGKYDLHETQNANGDDVDIWFTLTVNADGAGYEWEEEPGKKAIKNTIDAES